MERGGAGGTLAGILLISGELVNFYRFHAPPSTLAEPLDPGLVLTVGDLSMTITCYSMMKKTHRRIARAKRIPVGRRVDVTRAEFNRVIAILNERGIIINGLRDNQEMQFKRIAQLQAELDLLRRSWEKMRLGN
jgi:hypothetical protein